MMYVVKRDGRTETVHFDKIMVRLKKLSYGLSPEHCDPVLVAQKVYVRVYMGVTTSQLSPPRLPPRSPPPSLTMPPYQGLLCPTCRQVSSRQVEIVCVALVNR
uniref:ATP-cone domain-containing protein n=1 Tax=Aegilops tauschii subsp. strangulata TaxID=200361 RepID=A0A453EYT7_AEGTS